MIHLHVPRQAYLEEVNPGIICHIGSGNSILDVGCGSGALGEAMRQRGNDVIGIEQHPEAVSRAQTRLNRVIAADVTDVQDVRRQLGETAFDALVFSDVLEHLPDPLAILQAYLPCVRAGGKVLVSVPNAVVWDNRLRILFGSFDYCDTGVMDHTHLRFFTVRSAVELIRAAGLQVQTVDCTPHLVRAFLPLIKRLFFRPSSPEKPPDARAIIDSPAFRFYEKVCYPVELLLARAWKSALAFRVIVIAGKSPLERKSP